MFNFFTGKGQKEEERELVSIIIPSYNHELYIGFRKLRVRPKTLLRAL